HQALGLALGAALVGGIGHRPRLFRRLGDIGIEIAMLFHLAEIGIGQLAGGELLGSQAPKGGGHGEMRQIAHEMGIRYSTTLGTVKKPWAGSGALARIFSAWAPSLTISARCGRPRCSTPDIGSTPVVSTSFNCSTQVMMPFSSWARPARSCSGTRMRAKVA